MAVLCMYRKMINITSSLLNDLEQGYPNFTPDPSEAKWWAEELTVLSEQNDTVKSLLKKNSFVKVHKVLDNIDN